MTHGLEAVSGTPDAMPLQFLNLTTLSWEAQLPVELQPEYARLLDVWSAAWRSCHGRHGAAHAGALLAEDEAWDRLTRYCASHRYMAPSYVTLQEQVRVAEAACADLDVAAVC